MGTKATNINQATDGQGRILSGKGSRYMEAGAVGGNVETTTKAFDFAGAKTTGNITIGETGLGETFAEAVKALAEKNAAATAGLFSGLQSLAAPAATTETAPKLKWVLLGGLGLALLALLWAQRRK
jgi:hypothetical protein